MRLLPLGEGGGGGEKKKGEMRRERKREDKEGERERRELSLDLIMDRKGKIKFKRGDKGWMCHWILQGIEGGKRKKGMGKRKRRGIRNIYGKAMKKKKMIV